MGHLLVQHYQCEIRNTYNSSCILVTKYGKSMKRLYTNWEYVTRSSMGAGYETVTNIILYTIWSTIQH